MWFVILLIALVAAVVLWVRFAPTRPADWHVDPDTVTRTSRPNQYLLSHAAGADGPPARFRMGADDLARRIDALLIDKPGVTRIAGVPDDRLMTYVARTRLMGYPDFITIKVVDTDTGSEVSVYSRSRFGRSDFGVNKARITRWLDAFAN